MSTPLTLQSLGAVAMATAEPSWKWMVCALITALILGVAGPVLANDVDSCNKPSATGTSGSTQDLDAEATDDSRTNDSSGSRIVNGSDCDVHTQPWQGALLLKPNQLYCGAVLVNPQWLLTAAHCWKKLFKIRLGHHSLSPTYESSQQLFSGVKSIPHPGYTHPGHSNDVMLIKLNRRIHETQDVKPINISSHCPAAGTRCMVSGWGTVSSPNINFPKVLQCLNITVLSDDRCREAYPRQIDVTMFCAGDETGRDSCQGDSGGPVVCNGNLQGLVSWGDFPCAQPNRPGVYTKLCRFTKWIHDTIRSNS
ncbi:PREDICTED: kallikrein-5 [Hipposideros armiger]|uniref:tissue kallikrein n=1 Tax=Hipposideros armiger TaxID=186990 RepID=A0A8B7SK17_HIPAR|nr:PREDICTED: kallikrein-5 [Hipposideros armiger]